MAEPNSPGGTPPPGDWREQRRQDRWERRQQRWERRQQRWENGEWGGGRDHPWGGALFGLLMMVAGVLFLLRNLDIIYIDNLFSYWPVLLIGLGVLQLINGRAAIFPGLLLTGIGSVFLLRNFGIIQGNVGGFIWPIPLIALGASLLMRNLYGPDWWGGPASGLGGQDRSTEDRVMISTIFGGTDRKIVSQQFDGGAVSIVFGGAKLDLREAGLRQSPVTLRADAVFGGIEILVPDTWYVEVRGSGVFGGYEDHTLRRPLPEDAPRLIVRGGAVFGGVVVRN